MDDSLPDHFDIVIVGTGLQESILSGAFSRIGKKVLHIDPNDYYGGDWASFNIKSFKDFLTEDNQTNDENSGVSYNCAVNEELIALRNPRRNIHGFVEESNQDNTATTSSNQNEDEVETEPPTNNTTTATQSLYDKWRQFNIDVVPKLLFARGSLVELLIQSNVSRYLEFKIVDHILATLHATQKLELVPCSRADVFNSNFIKLIEKRQLMNLLTTALNYDENSSDDALQDYHDKPYREYLKDKRLSQQLQDFIIFSIAMVTNDTMTNEGLKATKKFLKSLGRYGNSAFIWPTYGVGEIPQAFSRLSAVFGGLFCLRRTAKSLIRNTDESGKCTAIVDNTGQKIKCQHVIVNESLIIRNEDEIQKKKYYRAVYVTDSSIYPSNDEHISLGILNPTESEPLVRLIEVGFCAGVSPRGHYVIHAVIDGSQVTTTTTHQDNLKLLFARTEQLLFNNDNQDAASGTSEKPNKLWAAYFTVSNPVFRRDDVSHLPPNVHVTLGPDFELGFDKSIKEAKEIFDSICPDDEFLPRAPDPEEIIFDDDDEGYNTERTSVGGGISSTHSIELSDPPPPTTSSGDDNNDVSPTMTSSTTADVTSSNAAPVVATDHDQAPNS